MKHSAARFDIESLRAFAVVAVMLFHAGISPFKSGFIGVDIFFVISGYLIIGGLMREYSRTRRIDVFGFWSRRVRRLLPASALVLSCVAVAAVFVSPRLSLADVRLDIISASLYAANIRFGITSIDYWAPAYISPVLHFWSLGVEEQFYIATPLLLLISHLILKRVKDRNLDNAFRLMLSVLLIWSFSSCVQSSLVTNSWAYFGTFGRVWEFALGGIAATLVLKKSARVTFVHAARILLWPLLLWSTLYISVSSGYPGWSTAIPVIATSLLLILGSRSTEDSNIPKWRTLVIPRTIEHIGGLSYSAYLWHWPILWLLAWHWNVTDVSPSNLTWQEASLGFVVTFIFAYATKRLVEDPVRFATSLRNSTRRSLSLGAATTAVSIAVVLASGLLPANASSVRPGSIAAHPVVWTDTAPPWLASAISEFAPASTFDQSLASSQPAMTTVINDSQPTRWNNCNAKLAADEPSKRCTFGDRMSKQVIVAFGDSHMDQYFGALDSAAKSLGYRFLPRTRSGCPAADIGVWLEKQSQPYPQCDAFRKRVLAEIVDLHPAIVIVSNRIHYTMIDPATGLPTSENARATQLWTDGYLKTLRALVAAGSKVIVVRDTPIWGFDVPECLATYSVASCIQPTGSLVSSPAYDLDIANKLQHTFGIDLTKAICAIDFCHAVRANMIVFRDVQHLTKTYSDALAPLWSAIIKHVIAD